MDKDDLLALVFVLVPLSLLSLGGGGAIIAGLEAEVVRLRQWLTPQEFIQLFAVSRAAPGPGVMLATLIGWQMAGWTGAVLATLALFLPSSLLFYAVFCSSNRHRDKSWHRIMRAGLAPVGTGLMIAGVIAIFRLSGGGPLALGIALAATGVLYRFPSVPALLVILLGGAVTLGVWAAG